MPRNRAECLNEDCIKDFYRLVKNIYDSIISAGGAIKPENVYNVDETAFSCDQGPMKVVCYKGTKYPGVINGDKYEIAQNFQHSVLEALKRDPQQNDNSCC